MRTGRRFTAFPPARWSRAVKRNLERFPEDFMFQLTAGEWAALRSQFVISNEGRGGRRYAPYAFTEQGVAMLSSYASWIFNGELRGVFGIHIAALAVSHGLDVEGDLASILPAAVTDR